MLLVLAKKIKEESALFKTDPATKSRKSHVPSNLDVVSQRDVHKTCCSGGKLAETVSSLICSG